MGIIRFFFRWSIRLIFLAIAVGIYAYKIEPHLLTIKEFQLSKGNKAESVAGQQAASGTLKIVQLSDLELSEDYTEEELAAIVEKVNALSPDLVFFTGDLFSNYAKYHPTESVVKALKQIDARLGKYAIWGNNDYGGGGAKKYGQIMEQSGFILLKNEGLHISLADGKTIFLGGLDDGQLGRPNAKKALEKLDESSDYNILLVHDPDLTDDLTGYPLNLVLAGHTHGGQVNISSLREYFGIDSHYIKGFYEPDTLPGTQLYVNSGLGTSRVPVRFLVPPQIACFNISL